MERIAQEDPGYVVEVKRRAEELERHLERYKGRLEQMRERNRALADDITSFERELDELHDWLVERL